jgi:hypothetical protein
MNLNFLFNSFLKTISITLNNKLSTQDFNTFKLLTREFQKQIQEILSDKNLDLEKFVKNFSGDSCEK